MQTNMRVAVGTLITGAICVFVTAALWILPVALSKGGEPDTSGWGELALMYSIFPAGAAAVLLLISFIQFVTASSGPRPR